MGYRARAAMCAGLIYLCMGAQLYILALEGRLDARVALPLHLCGFVGLLSPLVLSGASRAADSLCLLLGFPGAVLALAFPAVADTRHPVWMRLAFAGLHAGLVGLPFVRARHPRRRVRPSVPSMLPLLALLLALALFTNARWGANYLFLRAAPAGSPLEWFGAGGTFPYAARLLAAALLLSACMNGLWRRTLTSGAGLRMIPMGNVSYVGGGSHEVQLETNRVFRSGDGIVGGMCVRVRSRGRRGRARAALR